MDNFKENNDNKENNSELIGDAETIEKEISEDILDNDKDSLKDLDSNQEQQTASTPNFQKDNINHSYNYNSDEEKNKKDIKKLTILIIILFIVCFAGMMWSITRNSDNKVSKVNSNGNKSNVELKYTETTTSNNGGTYIIDVSEVVENVMPSIVAITSKTLVTTGRYGPGYYGNEQYATGAGSGIIVGKTDDELMILTNKHVVEDAEKLSVKFINDKSVDATVKGYSSSKDIAIITIPLSSLDDDTLKSIKIATMGNSNELKVGNGVIAIGNALGYGQSVTTGVISALNREVSIDNTTTNMIQTDAAINGGNSGGALLNSKGEVIGINSAKYSSGYSSSSASIEGMGFAIPISDVSDLITRLMNGENLSDEERGYLGVSGYVITEDYSKAYGIPVGFYISSIVKNSGADHADLEIGNIITEIDGNKVTQFADISEILETKKAKEKVTLTIKYTSGREYKEKKVTLTLSSYDDVN